MRISAIVSVETGAPVRASAVRRNVSSRTSTRPQAVAMALPRRWRGPVGAMMRPSPRRRRGPRHIRATWALCALLIAGRRSGRRRPCRRSGLESGTSLRRRRVRRAGAYHCGTLVSLTMHQTHHVAVLLITGSCRCSACPAWLSLLGLGQYPRRSNEIMATCARARIVVNRLSLAARRPAEQGTAATASLSASRSRSWTHRRPGGGLRALNVVFEVDGSARPAVEGRGHCVDVRADGAVGR